MFSHIICTVLIICKECTYNFPKNESRVNNEKKKAYT